MTDFMDLPIWRVTFRMPDGSDSSHNVATADGADAEAAMRQNLPYLAAATHVRTVKVAHRQGVPVVAPTARCGRTDPHGGHATPHRPTRYCAGNVDVVRGLDQ